MDRLLGVGVPTRREPTAIVEERGAPVVTAVVVADVAEHRRHDAAEVTFVLTPDALATIRYADQPPCRAFAAKCRHDRGAHGASEPVPL